MQGEDSVLVDSRLMYTCCHSLLEYELLELAVLTPTPQVLITWSISSHSTSALAIAFH